MENPAGDGVRGGTIAMPPLREWGDMGGGDVVNDRLPTLGDVGAGDIGSVMFTGSTLWPWLSSVGVFDFGPLPTKE